MKKLTLLFFVFHFSFFTFYLSEAQVIHVPGDYTTIQDAVNAASYGDTVLVDQGRYEENITIQGNNKAITLASNFIFSSDTNDINNTIIDASLPQNPNYGMGILLKNIDTTLMPKVIGFTITGGTGYYKTYGGGIYANFAIPVIENNRIEDCTVTGTQPNGAGIRVGQGIWDTNKVCLIRYNIIKNCTVIVASNGVVGEGAGISLGPISSIIEGNTITDNHIFGHSNSNAYGAGIVYVTGNPFYHTIHGIVKNNVITNNIAEGMRAGGGGFTFYDDLAWAHLVMEGNTISGNEVVTLHSSGDALGGGLLLENPANGSVISDNLISGNLALVGPEGSNRYGGGLYLNYTLPPNPDYSLLIEKNRINNNFALNGAAIYCQKTTINAVNNIISGNDAEKYAGGIYIMGQVTGQLCSFINNTIIDNMVSGQSGQGGSMFILNVPEVILMNNIYNGNAAPDADEIQIYNSTIAIHNCNINPDGIAGDWTGENNIYADPEFIDDNCHIAEDSPCEDQGADSIRVNWTWYYAPASDIDGTMRPWHLGIDIGAYECDIITRVPGHNSQQSAACPECETRRISCYPNPTGRMADFRLHIADFGRVSLKVYNAQGQEVAVVLEQEMAAGEHIISYDMSALPSGIYYYRLTTDDWRLTTGTGKIVKY